MLYLFNFQLQVFISLFQSCGISGGLAIKLRTARKSNFSYFCCFSKAPS